MCSWFGRLDIKLLILPIVRYRFTDLGQCLSKSQCFALVLEIEKSILNSYGGGLERILKIQNNFEKIKVKEIILPDLRLTVAIKTAHKTGIEI